MLGYEDTLEDGLINLLETSPSQEWFNMSIVNVLGEDWKGLGLEILKNMEREDLIPVFNKYAIN